MASPDICIPWVISNEDYTPPRCETVMDSNGCRVISGINEKSWPQEFDLINAQPQGLRLPMVQSFYARRYWNQWLARIASDEVAKRVMDFSVNVRSSVAVETLQGAVNLLIASPGPYLAVDGELGPETCAAANLCDSASLVGAFQNARADHYREHDADSPVLDALIARALR